ncbi:MAG: AAA family ATPase [Candidatus Heimdallarchaeota archaeon]|nr:AAA family ATPase [Candidatus Heimdallarchaeota archaeon]
MKVIVILGLPLSGKTTHAKTLVKEANYNLVETGTFVYQEVEDRGLEATPENVVKVAGECKAKSDSYFTEKALEYAFANFNSQSVFFLSGVKAISEVDYLNEKLGADNVFLVSFHASVKTRHSRLLNADRKAESKAAGAKRVEDLAMAEDIRRFNLRDTKELSYGLGKLIGLADFVVNTENIRWPHNNFEHTLSDFKEILSAIANS